MMNNQTIFNPDVYKKGEFYFKKGRVKKIENKEDAFLVSVMDTDLCQVTLKLDQKNQILESSCTCELGKSKKQCKHLVAAYLALTTQRQQKEPPLSVVYQTESKKMTAQYHKDNILSVEIKKEVKTS